jgi:hypothetical protein
MSTDSPANQALNVATAAVADGTTNAAWSNANTTEEIAGVFNDAQDVQNMDAARFTGQTSSDPARADSPGGADPTHNPILLLRNRLQNQLPNRLMNPPPIYFCRCQWCWR